MTVSPFEPNVTEPAVDYVPEQAGDREARTASPPPREADEDAEEPIEEPGYGHGV